MFKNQITKIVDILIKNGVAEIEYKEIIVYGLTFGIELILNILTTIILGFMFGMVIESLIFLISFSIFFNSLFSIYKSLSLPNLLAL